MHSEVAAPTVEHNSRLFSRCKFKVLDPQSINITYCKSSRLFYQQWTFQRMPSTFNPLPLHVWLDLEKFQHFSSLSRPSSHFHKQVKDFFSVLKAMTISKPVLNSRPKIRGQCKKPELVSFLFKSLFSKFCICVCNTFFHQSAFVFVCVIVCHSNYLLLSPSMPAICTIKTYINQSTLSLTQITYIHNVQHAFSPIYK